MKSVRVSHTASLLSNGKVLVTGGAINDIDAAKSTELYDPLVETWGSEDAMQMYRVWHTVSTLENGNLLITAGSGAAILENSLFTAEIYNATQ